MIGTTAAAGVAESGLGDALSEALGALLARGLSEALAPLAAAEVALHSSAAGPSGIDEIPLKTRLRSRREAEAYSAAPPLPALPGFAAPPSAPVAAKAGWRTDDPSNLAPLPANPQAQGKLDSAGIRHPVHDNGHRGWNKEIDRELEAIKRKLRDEHLSPGSDDYASRARELLQELQENLRHELLKSGRVTKDGTNHEAALA